ncbi:hypothetical protein ACGFYO_02775 [Streptomyces sp. NPDC048201]|uniref:hypothetical protein n=1 Tax=Streptomyces sp. NPDC048201 TaxID=3365513 RepID=UPI00371CD7E3
MNGPPTSAVTSSAPHRPLARWVARLDAGPPGSGDHRVTGPVNDGAERTDARSLPLFQDPAWRRVGLTARRGDGPAVPALALHHSGRDTAYVELDDYGRPLPASPAGALLVSRIEARWGVPPSDADVLRVLAGESLDLRHVLLHRLADETEPPPVLFHALPWAGLEAVAGNVLTMLDASGPVERPAFELRHWFTPAATRLAGPLAVLERGLREGREPVVLRREAAALLTGLLAARPERIPGATTHRLALLAERLGSQDPLLRHTARVIATRLGPGRPDRRSVSPSLALRMDPVLPAAARTTGSGYRTTVRDESFELRADHTPGGRVRVMLTVPAPPSTGEGAWTTSRDGLVAPLTIRTAETGTARLWIALREKADSLQGVLELFSQPSRLDLVADEPAVPFTALRNVPATDLVPSLRASSAATQRLWERAAAALPAEHPVPVALRLHRGEATR